MMIFTIIFLMDLVKHRSDFIKNRRFVTLGIIGFVTDFLDTLSIGCFATTQFAYRITKSSGAERLPGTLNAGHAIPALLKFVMTLGIISVDPFTLILMTSAAIIGSVAGANVVIKMTVNIIRYCMAGALFLSGTLLLLSQLKIGPFSFTGDANGLEGPQLIVGAIGGFILGALMSVGVGFNAPCTALCNLLGMNVKAAFPIFFGGCSFTEASAGLKFIQAGKYDRVAAALLASFGVLGVVAAIGLVENIETNILLWGVIIVMFYTAITFLLDARKSIIENSSAK
ncbi:MAG: permease [Eggerthellaceae bacterium]|nr:permease [Eggerthellaceae bacterium]